MDRNEWYSENIVKYELIKNLSDRELVILGDKRVRCIKIQNVYQLNRMFDAYKFNTGNNNLYYSLSCVNWKKFRDDFNIEYFSLCPKRRREQMDLFNRECTKYFDGYDLVIDFDNHDGQNSELVFNDCKKLKSVFDKHGISYSLRSSGSGFHISIKHDCLPKYIKAESDMCKKLGLIRVLVEDIKLVFDLETMDIGVDKEGTVDGSFYDERRIIKIPYSIDYKTGNVCLPLDDDQFNSFSEKLIKPDYVWKNVKVFNRGLLYRDGRDRNFEDFISKELI